MHNYIPLGKQIMAYLEATCVLADQLPVGEAQAIVDQAVDTAAPRLGAVLAGLLRSRTPPAKSDILSGVYERAIIRTCGPCDSATGERGLVFHLPDRTDRAAVAMHLRLDAATCETLRRLLTPPSTKDAPKNTES